MPAPPLYDVSHLNLDRPLFNIEDIRRVNPQRNQMEQLTAVIYINREHHGIVGYKDVTDEEFWVTGHMPGFPLMPGVVMCECVAQLAGFYARKFDILGGDFVGFGGMDDVRFRAPVFPGSRLILMAQVIKIRPKRQAIFQFQGHVKDRMVFNGQMIGVPISRDQKYRDNDD
ncbi:MAG TPA: 3-hydroxyacyl-ACP dehydratase FabZ family protein [Planctomycetaceae bacterium]|nr:3-hydroxyacyl-ACP dehydratase FabZ family protein [Planctomycetaceae bacterium]